MKRNKSSAKPSAKKATGSKTTPAGGKAAGRAKPSPVSAKRSKLARRVAKRGSGNATASRPGEQKSAKTAGPTRTKTPTSKAVRKRTSGTKPPVALRKKVQLPRRTPVATAAVAKPALTATPPKAPKASVISLPSPRARATPQTAPVTKAQLRTRKPVEIPPILLEGDVPVGPTLSGPGERFALSPAPDVPPEPALVKDKLPEAYGTERLFLTARDPHWLYASWDLTAEQHAVHARRARDQRLYLRCYLDDLGTTPVAEAPAPPESKNWFFHVDRASARYLAELGYYRADGPWHSIARSAATFTPPDSLSEVQKVEFVTIPPEVTLRQIFEAVQTVVIEHPPLVEAVPELRPEATQPTPESRVPQSRNGGAVSPAPGAPAPRPVPTRVHAEAPHPGEAPEPRAPLAPAPSQPWTPAQRHALADLVRFDNSRRVWMGSLEITELIRRHLEREISSAGAPAQAPAEQDRKPHRIAGVSSPLEQPAPEAGRERGFWFHLNAELVLYGATEPDARVRIAGRQIRLRPDGSFSYRFALPDGRYPLRISAESADGQETRTAQLEFSRRTEHHGPVGAHPQDSRLKTPADPDLD